MSKTIVSVAVSLLATLLPKIGVDIGSAELTSTIQTLVVVVSGVIIWIERVRKGDVSPLGLRK